MKLATATGKLVIGSFITAMHVLIYHVWCRVFVKIPNHSGDPAHLQAQIWCPAPFPNTKITFERKKDFRLLMRFRKIR